MKNSHPDRAVVEVPGSNMTLLIGQDEFGCVELSLGMKQQKLNQDASISNKDLISNQLEVLRKNQAFRVSEIIPESTVQSLCRGGLIRAALINDFKDQSLFALAGEAQSRWTKLIESVTDDEVQASETLPM